MNFQEILAFYKAEMITPIGLSFGMSVRNVDCYILEIIGDKDSPIRFNDRMIAFEDKNLCLMALERLRPFVPKTITIGPEYEFVCEINKTIEIISTLDRDKDGIVLNCVNTLLDFVNTSSFHLPDEYRILISLADRLTFKEELGEFVQIRSLIRNAFLWFAGMVSVNMMMIRSEQELNQINFSELSASPHKS